MEGELPKSARVESRGSNAAQVQRGMTRETNTNVLFQERDGMSLPPPPQLLNRNLIFVCNLCLESIYLLLRS